MPYGMRIVGGRVQLPQCCQNQFHIGWLKVASKQAQNVRVVFGESPGLQDRASEVPDPVIPEL